MIKYDLDLVSEKIMKTLKKPFLSIESVIQSCDQLSRKISSGAYDDLLERMGLRELISKEQLEEASELLSENTLYTKVETELGKDRPRAYPLGVLFHIGAGNVEGLGAYSIIEGLLTGNINLVKFSSDETGISTLILEELIKIKPMLSEYIYIFDFSSDEKALMKDIAALADALIIWGSDKTIKSIRAIAQPNQKIIEWGHRLSFAYVTMAGINKDNLTKLAAHIIKTGQSLCSSCQGIYLDSSDEEAIQLFCKQFITILEAEAKTDTDYDIGMVAESTLQSYTYLLENHKADSVIFKGTGVNLFYIKNSELEAAIQSNNIWVKALPRIDIIKHLKKHHGYLQTTGLLCSVDEKEELTQVMIKAGVTSIRSAGDMSDIYHGDAHDGEFPLRRYSKIINEYLSK